MSTQKTGVPPSHHITTVDLADARGICDTADVPSRKAEVAVKLTRSETVCTVTARLQGDLYK